VSRNLVLRWKKPFYSPWGDLAVAVFLGPESPMSRDQSLWAKWTGVGVSSLGDRSLRARKESDQRIRGRGKKSLRPHYWDERHPLKKRPRVLGRSLQSQTQSLRCLHTGVSGRETQSLRLRQGCNSQSSDLHLYKSLH
jgi:hypothetical protein